MRPTPEALELFRRSAAQVPFLKLLDIQLETMGDGEAEMSVVIQDKHLQTMGIAHGGVIASLLDSVTWWAAFAAQEVDPRHPVVSIDLKLNYLSALKAGRAVARGRCKKAGARLCYVVGEVLDESGRLIADGSSTLLVTK